VLIVDSVGDCKQQAISKQRAISGGNCAVKASFIYLSITV